MSIESFSSDIILYQSSDGSAQIEVKLENETVWLTQAQMAELFQKDVRTISEHIANVYEEGELEPLSTIRKFRTVRKEGKREVSREVEYYNLDVIISVGYRVKSHRGTQFRIWATRTLREYLGKGFVMDDERLANGGERMQPYFDEVVERVRAIRTSERNFYEKVKDVFATSIDYDPKIVSAKEFYSTVQNKFHYAITGQTAAEIVVSRIDTSKANMGLTNWSGEIVTRKDAEIAKNYLAEIELKQLQLLCDQFLSHAELQALRKRPQYMSDWLRKLDEFLKLNEFEILQGKGSVSHQDMRVKVKEALAKYVAEHTNQKMLQTNKQ